MTYRRCPGCREWYAKHLGECPKCSEPRAVWSKHLHTAKLNNHLYAQAESAQKEKKIERAYKAGYDIPPPKWALKRAKQIVSDM